MKSKESYYRTRFLIAHNALHEIVHHRGEFKKSAIRLRWKNYLSQLKGSEKLVKKPA